MHPAVSIEDLLALARAAGKAISAIYHDKILGARFSLKEDTSPLTLADSTSHDIITEGLHALSPDIPVLSEEGAGVPYEIRKHWEWFWCVDPLDGTKEFLRRNDEFTVNIALIHRQTPWLGVIYLPEADVLYYGSGITGSCKIVHDGSPVTLHTDRHAETWVSVGSRSHAGAGGNSVIQQYPVTRHMVAGSSLKFCLIAEGAAHLYYREGPTMEWDTAAGQAIVQYGGGRLCTLSGEQLTYNKQSLVNPPFICLA